MVLSANITFSYGKTLMLGEVFDISNITLAQFFHNKIILY